MPTLDASKEAEQRRLAWRCRRGLLELDIVLQRFMAQHFYALNSDELIVFDSLLQLPDNEFWDLLQNKSTTINAVQLDSMQLAIIKKLNTI